MPKKKIEPFETLDNVYLVEEQLGSGGVGVVYRVSDQDSKPFALKLFSSTNVSREKLKRFRNELEFLRSNRHPNLVPVLDYGHVTIDGKKLPFYVMPVYSGTLRKLMQSHLDAAVALRYFSQIIDGVEALHLKGVWHRDLKPENILFDEKNDNLAIADLGVAHFEEEALHTVVETKPSSRLANFQYAAPEQRRPGQVVTKSADIFALGLLLNEMITGDVIHGIGHRTVASVSPHYSYLDALVAEMVQQEPSKRPNSLDVIKRELIGRYNDFVKQQKISELESTVIPISELDDPIENDPIRIIDADFKGGILKFTVNRNVNDEWITSFKNPQGGISYPWGKEPSRYAIRGNAIEIDSNETDAPRIAEFLNPYLPQANRQYIHSKKQRMAEEDRRNRKAIQDRIDREKKEVEVRQRILDSIMF
jgi:serine/threonine protein kinase